ncbi:MAG: type II toxin-antitoxin system VapC family toxin [Candidatus Brocadia sp.]|jgi:predicted nucleic acid-binding protein
MEYFFDTSAIVKIYHQEVGSDVILPLYKGNDSIIISELSKVEFLSTIYKKFRNNEINLETVDALRSGFSADSFDRFIVIPIVSSIVNAALDLIEKYGQSNHLFSLDAMQVALYLAISGNNTTFVCADRRLTSFVKKLGYSALELQTA